MKHYKKGFTLIELLVVIAIIGILSSVVLASLNSARQKGSDAAVQAGLHNLIAQGAIYYSNNNSYNTGTAGAGCTTANSVFTDPQTINIINNVKSNALGGTMTCYSSSTGFTVTAAINSLGGHWCVDSNGNATNTNPSAGAYCE